MISTKMNKAILILSIFFLTQCYTDPFFELTVTVLDQNLNPVSNALVKIEIIDVNNGDLVEGSLISLEQLTNSTGAAFFNFENKAFVTARACFEGLSPELEYLCQEGSVYLEENRNKELSLMIQPADCSYCF